MADPDVKELKRSFQKAVNDAANTEGDLATELDEIRAHVGLPIKNRDKPPKANPGRGPTT